MPAEMSLGLFFSRSSWWFFSTQIWAAMHPAVARKMQCAMHEMQSAIPWSEPKQQASSWQMQAIIWQQLLHRMI